MRALLLLALTGLLIGAEPAETIISVDIDSVIHPVTEEIVGHAIDQAAAKGAAAVLIRLDTPGGMLESTRKIVERMMASPVPIVT